MFGSSAKEIFLKKCNGQRELILNRGRKWCYRREGTLFILGTPVIFGELQLLLRRANSVEGGKSANCGFRG